MSTSLSLFRCVNRKQICALHLAAKSEMEYTAKKKHNTGLTSAMGPSVMTRFHLFMNFCFSLKETTRNPLAVLRK